MTPQEKEIAEQIAESCSILGALNITHESLGHVSHRLDDNTMMIRGKGSGQVGLRYAQPRDVLKVDFNANKIEGADDLQPPSESFIHIWMYKNRPDVQSVIHAHPEHAVLLTITGKEILPIYGAFDGGSSMAVKGVPTFQRSLTITDDVLGEELATFMGDKDVCLMRGHGVTVVGDSVERSTLNTIHLDRLTTMTYKAYAIGTPMPIPDADIEQIKNRRMDGPRARGSAGGREGLLATYRYYKDLAADRLRSGA
jgi:ribulose-5-phosphate 4-epimerase/fuculose-1-phosphate aldolase